MILIAYDGSDDATSAITQVGALMSGQPATVLTVWEELVDLLVRTPGSLGGLAAMTDVDDVDEASRSAAERTADEGTSVARQAGLAASARVGVRSGSMADTILTEADTVSADLIVLGSRGLAGLGSVVLGSVSHAVLQHADRAVLVVPSPKVAKERGEKLRARVR